LYLWHPTKQALNLIMSRDSKRKNDPTFLCLWRFFASHFLLSHMKGTKKRWLTYSKIITVMTQCFSFHCISDITKEVLSSLEKLGFSSFRPGQQEAVMRILCGKCWPTFISSFCDKKCLGVFLPFGWNATLSQHLILRYPFTDLSGEKHRESKVSWSRTQRDDPVWAQIWTAQSGSKCTNHEVVNVELSKWLRCCCVGGNA